MASTYSTNLALELIGTGDQAGTWGLTTNTNLGTLIEQAISGYVTQAVATGTDTTITIPNGATGVARNMYIELTGTGGTNTNLIVPANKKLYFIFNNTSSGQVTVKVSGQTGVSVPNKAKMILVSNGTDIVDATNYIGNISAASANITTLTSASATITNLIATSGSISTLVSSDLSATVARSASATITNLLATSTTVSSGSTLNGGVVINEPGADVDFRVESDTDANCLFVDASANAVGIGTSSPGYKLQVNGASSGVAANIGYNGDTGTGLYVGADHANSLVQLYASGGASKSMVFYTGNSEVMRYNTDGNLGLGVTPSAWGSGYNVMQLGVSGAIYGRPANETVVVSTGAYNDGTSWKYQLSGNFASQYTQASGSHIWYTAPSGTAGNSGSHIWYTAPSGTAGNAITFTQAMTLDASGNLGVGTTSPSSYGKFVVQANGLSQSALAFVDTNTSGRSWSIGPGTGTGVATDFGFYDITGAQIASLYTAGASGKWAWYTNGTERARIDASGNLGLGVTPSAWGSLYKAIQNGQSAFMSRSGGSDCYILSNNYYDGTNFKYINTAAAAYYRQEAGTHAWLTAPSGTAGNAISFTQAMTLDASGNLGVGASSPSEKLDVAGNIGSFRVESSGARLILTRDDANYIRYGSTNGVLIFEQGTTERARIDSSGNLLVGTTSNGSSSRMIVNGTATGANQRILQILSTTAGDVSNAALLVSKRDNDTTTSQVFVQFSVNNDSTSSGQINANGASQAAFGSWSDRRLKTNIVDLPPQLSNILALRPVEFDYIESEGGGHQINFIAQEMENVYPDAVGERQDGMKTITGWGKTEARLVKAIQEQQAMINELKAKVAALEAK